MGQEKNGKELIYMLFFGLTILNGVPVFSTDSLLIVECVIFVLPPDFFLSEVTAPLNALRKKGVKSVWGKAQHDSFESLKEAIMHPPVSRMLPGARRVLA